MSDDLDTQNLRTLMHTFELDPITRADPDEIIRRGRRHSRLRTVDRALALAAVSALVLGVAVIATGSLRGGTVLPPSGPTSNATAATPSTTTTPPTPVPSATLPAVDANLSTHADAVYHGAVTTRMTLNADPGTTLDPPVAGTTPQMSWQQVWTGCSSAAPCDGPDIYLVRATEWFTNVAMHPDGSTTPNVHNRLAYLLVWSGQVCVPSGPARGGPLTASPPATEPRNCTVWSFVDANTGKSIDGGSATT